MHSPRRFKKIPNKAKTRIGPSWKMTMEKRHRGQRPFFSVPMLVFQLFGHLSSRRHPSQHSASVWKLCVVWRHDVCLRMIRPLVWESGLQASRRSGSDCQCHVFWRPDARLRIIPNFVSASRRSESVCWCRVSWHADACLSLIVNRACRRKDDRRCIAFSVLFGVQMLVFALFRILCRRCHARCRIAFIVFYGVPMLTLHSFGILCRRRGYRRRDDRRRFASIISNGVSMLFFGLLRNRLHRDSTPEQNFGLWPLFL
jgi:hypothetical protein